MNTESMKTRLVVLAIALVACQRTTEPTPDQGALPLMMVGSYKLVSINGQPVPWEVPPGANAVARDTIISGGMTIIAADSAWAIGDTTRGTMGVILFKWGGKVAPNGSGGWAFTDSSRIGTRYTGTISGDIFTLVSSRTYRYQRAP